jgi:hypothetical protein
MKHQGVEALLHPRRIEKIYTSPVLLAEYNALVDQILELDWRYEPPPPLNIATLDHLKNVLAALKLQIAKGEFLP